jgi:hypothetical protein
MGRWQWLAEGASKLGRITMRCCLGWTCGGLVCGLGVGQTIALAARLSWAPARVCTSRAQIAFLNTDGIKVLSVEWFDRGNTARRRLQG